MGTLQWLEYFTDEISEITISVGEKVYSARRNPDFAPGEEFVPFDAGGLIELASQEEINKAEFFYGLAQILNTKAQWERFFSNDGVNMSVTNEENRYRLYATNGLSGNSYAVIRKIPPVIAFSPDN